MGGTARSGQIKYIRLVVGNLANEANYLTEGSQNDLECVINVQGDLIW